VTQVISVTQVNFREAGYYSDAGFFSEACRLLGHFQYRSASKGTYNYKSLNALLRKT